SFRRVACTCNRDPCGYRSSWLTGASGAAKKSRHGTNGPLREDRQGGGRPRPDAPQRRSRTTRIRQRVEGRVAHVARALQDADQRVSPGFDQRTGSAHLDDGDGKVLLRRRLRVAPGLRAGPEMSRSTMRRHAIWLLPAAGPSVWAPAGGSTTPPP